MDDDFDLTRRFGGIARLYGNTALKKFKHSHVCIIGVGGVGSWVVEALARSGIGEISLIDMDHITESNINRQLPALTDTLGKSKIAVLKERAININPSCKIHLIDEFVSIENLSTLINSNFNYIIDCIDDFRTKAALINYCKEQSINLLTTGGAGGKVDPLKIRLTDLARSEKDPLLAKTRSHLRQKYNYPRNVKRNFKISCVWSDEQAFYPTEAGEVTLQRPGNTNTHSLNCGGLGSSTMVTATYGFIAVSHVLKQLAAASDD